MRNFIALSLLLIWAGGIVLEAEQSEYTEDVRESLVDCGCHEAPTCPQCGNLPHECNADCKWTSSGCITRKGILSDLMQYSTKNGSECYILQGANNTDTILKGCPTSIPITLSGKIVAGRVYTNLGNDIPELSCNGDCHTAFAETQITEAGIYFLYFASVIINPGCTLHIFQDHNYRGDHKSYSGPLLLPNPQIEGPITDCGIPCVGSMIWTCKQTYPTCQPSDSWHEVTELNNAASTIPTTFSYKKTVGTTFSHSIQKSMEVSETVSLAISAKFWAITASMRSTTGFKWNRVTTDTETTSKEQSYTVEVEVPAGKTVRIEEAMGTCGESKIYTQMFRILDSPSGTQVAMYQGKIAKYTIDY